MGFIPDIPYGVHRWYSEMLERNYWFESFISGCHYIIQKDLAKMSQVTLECIRKCYKNSPQQVFTCSKSTMETQEQHANFV